MHTIATAKKGNHGYAKRGKYEDVKTSGKKRERSTPAQNIYLQSRPRGYGYGFSAPRNHEQREPPMWRPVSGHRICICEPKAWERDKVLSPAKEESLTDAARQPSLAGADVAPSWLAVGPGDPGEVTCRGAGIGLRVWPLAPILDPELTFWSRADLILPLSLSSWGGASRPSDRALAPL